MHLKPDHSTFSEDLEVYSVNESGIPQPLFLNRTHFYTGTVFGWLLFVIVFRFSYCLFVLPITIRITLYSLVPLLCLTSTSVIH